MAAMEERRGAMEEAMARDLVVVEAMEKATIAATEEAMEQAMEEVMEAATMVEMATVAEGEL
eukprot:1516946-Prymnesium_polylepis.1